MDAKISSYIIGIIMFVFIIFGGIYLINIMQEKNGNFVDTERYADFNSSVNKYAELNDKLGDIQSSVVNAPVDQSTLGVLSSLIQTAWNTLKALPTTLGFMQDAIIGLCEVFGIPAWIPGLLMGIITIIIIFVIFGAIFQTEM